MAMKAGIRRAVVAGVTPETAAWREAWHAYKEHAKWCPELDCAEERRLLELADLAALRAGLMREAA